MAVCNSFRPGKEASVFMVGVGDDGGVVVGGGGGFVGVVGVFVVGRGQDLLLAAWNYSWPAWQRGEHPFVIGGGDDGVVVVVIGGGGGGDGVGVVVVVVVVVGRG